MRAGELRHRVMILRPVKTQSAISGGVTTSWENVREVDAAIQQLTARELSTYATTQQVATHRVKTRYTSDITGDSALRFEGRTFHVIGPPNNVGERGVELVFTVKEQR